MVKRYVVADEILDGPTDLEFGRTVEEAAPGTVLEPYISLEGAEAWIALNVLGATAWNAATNAEKLAALGDASLLIDSLPLKGRKYSGDPTQAREFPREYMRPEGWVADTNSAGEVVIPQAIKDACCIIAVRLLAEAAASEVQPEALQQAGITSIRLGDMAMTFKDGAAGQYKGLKSRTAYNLMKPYILRSVMAR